MKRKGSRSRIPLDFGSVIYPGPYRGRSEPTILKPRSLAVRELEGYQTHEKGGEPIEPPKDCRIASQVTS
jgi:hypothetical protein